MRTICYISILLLLAVHSYGQRYRLVADSTYSFKEEDSSFVLTKVAYYTYKEKMHSARKKNAHILDAKYEFTLEGDSMFLSMETIYFFDKNNTGYALRREYISEQFAISLGFVGIQKAIGRCKEVCMCKAFSKDSAIYKRGVFRARYVFDIAVENCKYKERLDYVYTNKYRRGKFLSLSSSDYNGDPVRWPDYYQKSTWRWTDVTRYRYNLLNREKGYSKFNTAAGWKKELKRKAVHKYKKGKLISTKEQNFEYWSEKEQYLYTQYYYGDNKKYDSTWLFRGDEVRGLKRWSEEVYDDKGNLVRRSFQNDIDNTSNIYSTKHMHSYKYTPYGMVKEYLYQVVHYDWDGESYSQYKTIYTYEEY